MILLSPLVTANTIDKARELAVELGSLAHGVTVNSMGIRIRVLHSQQVEAKQTLDPRLSEAAGEDLKTANVPGRLQFLAAQTYLPYSTF